MLSQIDVNNLSVEAVDLWKNRWLLLTAGNSDEFNMMTVAWGSIGCMWKKPFVQIVVRPQRYTRGFTDKFSTFTLSAFSELYREDLQIMGSVSGKDGDKLSKTKLSIKKSAIAEAPAYNEADLILECRKIYVQDMTPDGFLDNTIENLYAAEDYHRIYYGEILAVWQDL